MRVTLNEIPQFQNNAEIRIQYDRRLKGFKFSATGWQPHEQKLLAEILQQLGKQMATPEFITMLMAAVFKEKQRKHYGS